ncbi:MULTISPECIES: MHFG family PEP-CTERM protein [unclassified Duganella]|uniref:MHFG family PEP-CTERM protein n=1 Tax=unclassified Duganella TaxID=2636909 RepID=UPI00088F8F6F|nr:MULTISPECIES: MHFG family PEP-CTERM protein [unclassified Duganella]SDF71693.1 hypothetical protein SAMN05216320_1011079 [Duganella sp. OV458]SDI57682.1 hypothetical protein SAMN05428973_101336 [Duganella sp. OV510]
MSFLFAVTLAAAVQPTCSWDHPGRNPYTGSTAAAIDRYTDIPEAVRSTLKRRLEEGLSDDKVSITREHIAGKYQYDNAIRDMHFGSASVCATVTRDKWAETRAEPAAVYCVEKHCILVPRICGNVSRITRTPGATIAQNEAAADDDALDKKQPQQFSDIRLADGAKLDSEPLDEAEEEARRVANQRALDGLGDILTEEELADAADASRFGAFGRHGVFGMDDDLDFHSPVSAVPETETWAMLLAGLSLIGWQARRRARKQA